MKLVSIGKASEISRYVILGLHCTFLFEKTDEYKEFADLNLSCGCNYGPKDIESLLEKEQNNDKS